MRALLIILTYIHCSSAFSQSKKEILTSIREINKKIESLEKMYISIQVENKKLKLHNEALSDSLLAISRNYYQINVTLKIQEERYLRLASLNSRLRVSLDSINKEVTYKAKLEESKKAKAENSLPQSGSSSSYNSFSSPAPAPKRPSSNSYRTYYTGPRGGCYYIGGTGKKVYVDRSLCR